MRVSPARGADLARLAPRLAPLPLCRAYGMSEAWFSQRLGQAMAAQGAWVVASASDDDVPMGLAWFDGRGGFAVGAYLRLLLVAPEAQGCGYGAALLRAFEAQCEAAPGGYFALTNVPLGQALGFYTRHGYGQVGILPNFVRAGCTETVLWKPHPARSA